MSENYKLLDDLIDSEINPSAGIQGINATGHNSMLKSFSGKQGRWTGYPYALYNNVNDLKFTGGVNFNGGSFNDNEVTISVAEYDEYVSRKDNFYKDMGEGSYILIREYNGNHGFYKVKSFTVTNPPMAGILEVYHFVCTSQDGNSSFTPSTTEGVNTQSMMEFYPVGTIGLWNSFDGKITGGTNFSIPGNEHNFGGRLYSRIETIGLQKRVYLRGYIQASGGAITGDIFTINDAAFDCNDVKVVNLSNEAGLTFYRAIITGNKLTTIDNIPDTAIVSIEIDYYNTDPTL